MSAVEAFHADHGATFTEIGGRRLPLHFGRPETTHRAVRNGVGVIEMPYGVVSVSGEDRLEYVDNVVSNRVPEEEGRGRYALLCEPKGRIRMDLYVYNAGQRLLVLTPAGEAGGLADDWGEKVFIQDVEIEHEDDVVVFGVHGPMATEKVASVFGGGAPEGRLVLDRGRIGDAGVTVVATDGLAGEEGYEVICTREEARSVLDSLLTRGLNAVPVGLATWRTLTLEAGTPLFESELRGRIPNVLGLDYAVDFEKGCFVGQEVISRIHNRGQPGERLVGLRLEVDGPMPEPGSPVTDGERDVGEVTRAAVGPTVGGPIALAVVDAGVLADGGSLAIGGGPSGGETPAERATLPFVEGSAPSGRVPTYD